MEIKNIFLITVDCFRHDYFNQDRTPFLNSLRDKSIVFENAFANGPFTSASFISLLGGVLPLDFGYYAPLPDEVILLSERLKILDFTTIGVHSNPYLSSFFGYNRGFDIFEDFMTTEMKFEKRRSNPIIKLRDYIVEKWGPSHPLYHLLSSFFLILPAKSNVDLAYQDAKTTVDTTMKHISDNQNEQLFVWMHLMDTHTPYAPPKTYLDQVNFEDNLAKLNFATHLDPAMISTQTIDVLKSVYTASLSYIDDQLEIFFDYLDANNLNENSLIVVTADHGEEFKEHDGITHFPKFYDELIHVPLLIMHPAIKPTNNEDLVSLKDITPTIVKTVNRKAKGNSILDVTYTKSTKYVQGACTYEKYDNFFEQRDNKTRPQKRKFYMRNKTHKYIYNQATEQGELFDLRVDPQEQRPLPTSEPNELIELLHQQV